MSLLDDARRTQAGTMRGPECSVIKAMRLHPDHADDIAAVIRDREISGGSADRTFAAYGIDVTKITVERHRRGQCATCRANGVEW